MQVQEKLRKCDLFGKDVKIFYKGDDIYTTKYGAVVTILVGASFLILTGLKAIEFFLNIDPIRYFFEMHQDMEEKIDLRESGFKFAIQTIEEEIGTIEAYHVDWNGVTGAKK